MGSSTGGPPTAATPYVDPLLILMDVDDKTVRSCAADEPPLDLIDPSLRELQPAMVANAEETRLTRTGAYGPSAMDRGCESREQVETGVGDDSALDPLDPRDEGGVDLDMNQDSDLDPPDEDEDAYEFDCILDKVTFATKIGTETEMQTWYYVQWMDKSRTWVVQEDFCRLNEVEALDANYTGLRHGIEVLKRRKSDGKYRVKWQEWPVDGEDVEWIAASRLDPALRAQHTANKKKKGKKTKINKYKVNKRGHWC